MSNQQTLAASGGDSGLVNSVTGSNGVGASPTTGNVVVSGINATTSQIGVVTLASNAQAIAGSNTTNAVTPAALTAKLGTQTLNGLAYGGGTTAAVNWLGAATNGQIPIGSTGLAPVLGNITSTDGSIIITNGAGTIDLSAFNHIEGTGSTVGAVTSNIITFPLGATPATYTFESRVSGFNSATPASCGFQIFGTVRTTGASAVIVGDPDYVSNAETALAASDALIVVSGNNAIIQVTGVAGLTINWQADLEYTFVS